MHTHGPARTDIRGSLVATDLYIDGGWRTARQSFDVTNPATGARLGEMSDAGPSEAIDALDAAAAAAESWANWPPRRRADLFRQAHAALHAKADQLATIIVAESGKPLPEAKSEVELSLDFFLWFTEQIAHLTGRFHPGSPGGYRIVETHHPIGPSYLVTPWNFPLLMSARKAGAALAAGCTVIMKSARLTPFTAAAFVETLHEVGLPRGVLNLIHTTRAGEVSTALLRDGRLRKLSFTGSTAVGRTLLAQAAGSITSSAMELGGDGPFLVLADADVAVAAREAVACRFRNAGQACVAANRIVLHEAIADEFTDEFVRRVGELKVGDGFDPGVDVGPIISGRQRDRAEALVADLVAAGGELLTGGHAIAGAGHFFEPTVISMPTFDHPLCHEELFAPIATLYRARTTAEAVARANESPLGLAGYVFTRDVSRAIRVAESLECGMVGVNRGIMADPAAPFGGVKASGLGREGGHDGIYEFTEPQYIAITVDDHEGEGS